MAGIRGGIHTESEMDDVVKQWGADLQEVSHLAQDRSNWQKMVKQASDVSMY